jgi:hypothetical protein
MTWNPQQNPYQPGSQFNSPMGGGPPSQSDRDKLKGPGIGLIVVGGIGLLSMGAYFVLTLIGLFMQPEVMNERENLQGPELVGFYFGFYGFLAAIFFNTIFQILVIAGGFSLIRGKLRGLCMTACIASLIPCTSGCCIFGIPFGIWGLVVLSDPNVKRVFQ